MDAAMALLLLLHVVAAAAMPAATARWGAKAFLLGATAPGTAAVWGAFRFREVVTDSVVRETLTWAPQLGLDVQLRLDALALVMVALVSGIGCVVLVYSAWYFGVSGASPSAGDGHTSEGARGTDSVVVAAALARLHELSLELDGLCRRLALTEASA